MDLTETWLEALDLTGDGGAIKRVYLKGDADGAKPDDGDKVHVLYEGRLASDGTVFDKSLDHEAPFSFKLGQGQVIKGWDVGIASMVLGERAELVLKPEYAYGDTGAGSSIPPGASLIFKVELVRIAKGPKAARYRKSDSQLFEEAKAAKEQGNQQFKATNLFEARKLYNEAHDLVLKVGSKSQEHNDFRKTVLLNICVASNKIGDYKNTVDKATEALHVDPKLTKAFYLRAQA